MTHKGSRSHFVALGLAVILEGMQVSYEKQIAIIDKIMKRVIEYCKARVSEKN